MQTQLALSAPIVRVAPIIVAQLMQELPTVKTNKEEVSQLQVFVREFHLYPGRHEQALRRGS